MRGAIVLALAACYFALAGICASAGAPDAWRTDVIPEEPWVMGFEMGCRHLYHDGWDGQSSWNPAGYAGVAAMLYRRNGPGWAGPTGLFNVDYESPIPWGDSKTWWDIYLWAQNYAPPGGSVRLAVAPYPSDIPPAGYVGRLVLDYVPQSLNWTGPTEFEMDMTRGYWLTLPVPTVTDPLQGTRMHLTVYAIPEPSSLAALGFALPVLACAAVHRRRR